MRTWLSIFIALALFACGEPTDVRFVHCQNATVYRTEETTDSISITVHGERTSFLADSIRFSDCDDESWEGEVVYPEELSFSDGNLIEIVVP